MLRRQGTPMRAHLQLPDHNPQTRVLELGAHGGEDALVYIYRYIYRLVYVNAQTNNPQSRVLELGAHGGEDALVAMLGDTGEDLGGRMKSLQSRFAKCVLSLL